MREFRAAPDRAAGGIRVKGESSLLARGNLRVNLNGVNLMSFIAAAARKEAKDADEHKPKLTALQSVPSSTLRYRCRRFQRRCSMK